MQVAQETSPQAVRGQSPFWPFAILLLLWIAVLAILTWTTANPITLNLAQVHTAKSIVRARVLSKSEGLADVLETVHGAELTGKTSIANLRGTHAVDGEEYILPLNERRTGWQIVVPEALESPDIPPLIYPATPSVVASIRQILGKP